MAEAMSGEIGCFEAAGVRLPPESEALRARVRRFRAIHMASGPCASAGASGAGTRRSLSDPWATGAGRARDLYVPTGSFTLSASVGTSPDAPSQLVGAVEANRREGLPSPAVFAGADAGCLRAPVDARLGAIINLRGTPLSVGTDDGGAFHP